MVQSYENFTGGVLMSLVEHGFFKAEEANDFLTPENLMAPTGKLPLNTSGGNLAECYMHGLELQVEAVRQLRGQSTAQVPDADVVDGDLRPDGDAGVEHDPGLGGDAMSYLPNGLPAPVPENDGAGQAVLGGARGAAS